MSRTADTSRWWARRVLEARGVTVQDRRTTVLAGVDLDVDEADVVGLIGPAHSGVGALLECLTGARRPTRGSVRFRGVDVARLRPRRRVELGIARTFARVAVLSHGTVRDNLVAAQHVRAQRRYPSALRQAPRARLTARDLLTNADEILDQLSLSALADAPIDELSHHELRRVELAAVLVNRPSLLVLEEPSTGVRLDQLGELVASVSHLRGEFRLTMVVADSYAPFVFAVSDRVCCLDGGRVIAAGGPEAVRADPRVRAALCGPPDP